MSVVVWPTLSSCLMSPIKRVPLKISQLHTTRYMPPLAYTTQTLSTTSLRRESKKAITAEMRRVGSMERFLTKSGHSASQATRASSQVSMRRTSMARLSPRSLLQPFKRRSSWVRMLLPSKYRMKGSRATNRDFSGRRPQPRKKDTIAKSVWLRSTSQLTRTSASRPSFRKLTLIRI
jgi:hypothetical protein